MNNTIHMNCMKFSFLAIFIVTSLISCINNDNLPDSIVYKPSDKDQKTIDSLFREKKEVSFDTTKVIEKLCWEFVCFSNEIEILDAYYTVTQSHIEHEESGKPFSDTNSVVLFVAVSKENEDVEYWSVHCDLEEGGNTYKIKKRDLDTLKISR